MKQVINYITAYQHLPELVQYKHLRSSLFASCEYSSHSAFDSN